MPHIHANMADLGILLNHYPDFIFLKKQNE